MNTLLGYLKKHWFFAVLGPLFMTLEVAMDLLQPLFMSSIIDDGVMVGNYEHIIKLGGYMLIAALFGLIGGVGCTIFASIASMKFGHDLRNDAYLVFSKMKLKQMDNLEAGSVITRLTNDVNQVQSIVSMLLRVLVRQPLLLVGSLFMVIFISVKLSIIVAVSVPLLFIVMWIVIRKTMPLFANVQLKLDRMNTVLQESLSGIRASKVFVRAEYEAARFAEANDGYTNHSIKAQAIMALNGPILMLILNFSTIGVLLLGGHYVIEESFEVGLLIAYINYVVQLLHAVSGVANNLVRLSRAKISADRVVELLHMEVIEPKMEKQTHAIKGEIVYDNVSFRYNPNKLQPTLSALNITIKSGSKTAILGATGSGKSTLVSLLPRLYEHSKGQIFIDGKPIEHFDQTYLRKNISYVLQDLTIFSGTLAFNIAFSKPDATEEQIHQAAYVACLDEYIGSLPQGYETVIGEKGVNLSGGQKQRLAIARAVIEARPIIIFDDSTSAIDLRTEGIILNRLKTHSSNSTLIIVAQKISSVMDADQIILLEAGEVIAFGTHTQLMKTEQAYIDIYESQLGKEVQA